MHDLPLQVNRDGSQKRDYIYVSDVARAFLGAALHSPKDKTATYAVCTGKQVPLSDIITRIGSASGKKITVTHTDNPEPAQLPVIKPEAARKELRWKPTVSLEEGVKQIIKKDYEDTGAKT
jgi:UDP-glucose 4-epimerase